MKEYLELIGNLAGCGAVIVAVFLIFALTIKGVALAIQFIF